MAEDRRLKEALAERNKLKETLERTFERAEVLKYNINSLGKDLLSADGFKKSALERQKREAEIEYKRIDRVWQAGEYELGAIEERIGKLSGESGPTREQLKEERDSLLRRIATAREHLAKETTDLGLNHYKVQLSLAEQRVAEIDKRLDEELDLTDL